MARQNGRDINIRDSLGALVAVAVSQTITINNTPVDVTGNDDAGFITYISRPATKQISASIQGVLNDTTLLDVAVTGTGLLDSYSLDLLDAATGLTPVYTIEGNFYLTNFVLTGSSDGKLEFTADIASSGAFTRTLPI